MHIQCLLRVFVAFAALQALGSFSFVCVTLLVPMLSERKRVLDTLLGHWPLTASSHITIFIIIIWDVCDKCYKGSEPWITLWRDFGVCCSHPVYQQDPCWTKWGNVSQHLNVAENNTRAHTHERSSVVVTSTYALATKRRSLCVFLFIFWWMISVLISSMQESHRETEIATAWGRKCIYIFVKYIISLDLMYLIYELKCIIV